jgi:hypothetical protein
MTVVAAAVQQAKSLGMTAAMTLKTIDSNSRTVPADLASKAWSDPIMITRFRNMLKVLGPLLGTTVKWIQLANEVDLYFPPRQAEIAGFKDFFDAGKIQLSTSAPSSSVGLAFSYDALRLNNQTFTQLKSLGTHMGFTFYNLDGTTTRPSNTIPVEIPTMIKLAAGKPIVLTEVGYPSAPGAGSSVQGQSEFYSLLFAELRKASGKIVAARAYQMTDLPMNVAASIASAYGYPAHSPFAYYLGSLGMATESGAYKPAYSVFQANLPLFLQQGYCYSTTNP